MLGRSKEEESVRRAVKALAGGRSTPSEEVVASIFDTAAAPYDLDMVTMPYGPPEAVSVGSLQQQEIGAALFNEEVALAIQANDRLIYFRPNDIAAMLQQDPDVRNVAEWNSLVATLVIYGFRVASITTRGDRFRLDVHHMYRR